MSTRNVQIRLSSLWCKFSNAYLLIPNWQNLKKVSMKSKIIFGTSIELHQSNWLDSAAYSASSLIYACIRQPEMPRNIICKNSRMLSSKLFVQIWLLFSPAKSPTEIESSWGDCVCVYKGRSK